MSHKWNLIIATISLCVLQAAHANLTSILDPKNLFGKSPRKDLPFPELVKYDGYEHEVHTVTTSDGYILTVYRLPLKPECSGDPGRPPLVFMHGLYLSSDDCIVPGPGKAHCYIYADACHDVWVPNSRGNRYSRNHTTLNPDKDHAFWNFGVDELALKDLPAIIDYILEKTGQPKVNYVAHSQGVTMAILMCAKLPEYNAKFNAGFGLSVTAHLEKARFIVIQVQALVSSLTTSKLGHVEVLAHGDLIQKSAELVCGTSTIEYPFCSLALFAVFGYNKFQITKETLPVMMGHLPCGTSLKNFARWGQLKKNGFSEIDYGAAKNLIKYGSVKPPLFDLSAVTMPWYFIGSENDYVGDLRDIAKLQKQLKNVQMCVLPDKTFAHLDFIYGKDIPNYLTPKILSVMAGGSFKCN